MLLMVSVYGTGRPVVGRHSIRQFHVTLTLASYSYVRSIAGMAGRAGGHWTISPSTESEVTSYMLPSVQSPTQSGYHIIVPSQIVGRKTIDS